MRVDPHRSNRRSVRLRRNVMRSVLTTLGIVIGIARGHRDDGDRPRLVDAIQKTVASMGANNLMVFPGRPPAAA